MNDKIFNALLLTVLAVGVIAWVIGAGAFAALTGLPTMQGAFVAFVLGFPVGFIALGVWGELSR